MDGTTGRWCRLFLPVQRPDHHYHDTNKEHDQADAVHAMHEAQARITIAFAEKGGRVEVMKDALEEHRSVLRAVKLLPISGTRSDLPNSGRFL